MEKRTEVTFDGVTYSLLAIINKEELLGEWQVFKRALFRENKYIMKIKHQPSLLARRKRQHGNKLCLDIFQNF